MNEALLEAFRHNTWATKELLGACRNLTREQLTSPATGTYGGIVETFNHIIGADGGYVRRLSGDGPGWIGEQTDDLAELAARTDEIHALWERYLSQPVDIEEVLMVDDGALAVRAGVILTQALHHGSAHREQICAILTGYGIEPPDVQAWAYAEATGRMWPATS